MSVLDCHPPLAYRIGLLTCLLGLGAGAFGAEPLIPNGQIIPRRVILAIAIPDCSRAWDNASKLPVTRGLLDLLNRMTPRPSPSSIQEKNWRRDLDQLAGFPVKMPFLMKEVFGDLVLYITPPHEEFTEAHVVIVVTAQDQEKAKRLIGAFDQINAQFATQSEDGVFSFQKIDLKSTTVGHFTIAAEQGEPLAGYYCIARDRMLFSNDLDRLAQCVRLIENDGALRRPLIGRSDLISSAQAAGWNTGDINVWVDRDGLMENFGFANYLSLIPGFLGSPRHFALSFRLSPEGIAIQTAGANERLPGKKVPGLKGLPYLHSAPISALDIRIGSKRFYKLLIDALRNFQGHTGTDLPLPSANDDFGRQFEETFTANLGFSLREDILPALGEEWFVSLGSIDKNSKYPDVPLMDLVLGIDVADTAVIKLLMTNIEARIEEVVAKSYPDLLDAIDYEGPRDNPPVFESYAIGDQTARVIMFPVDLGLSPCYILTPDPFLIISLNIKGLEAALARNTDQGENLLDSDAYAAMTRRIDGFARRGYMELNIPMLARAIQEYPLLDALLPANLRYSVKGLIGDITPYIDLLTAVQVQRSNHEVGHLFLQMK